MVGAQVAQLGASLLERADELAEGMVEHIYEAVPVYRSGAVDAAELSRTCLEYIRLVFEPMGRESAAESPRLREGGRRRAQVGVPLTAVMEAYRVTARYLWGELAETAARNAVSAEVALRAASELWRALDIYTRQMSEGYREELTAQLLSREQERSAVVQALLEGCLADTNLWEAADLLRLPQKGPYVVVAASAPDVAKHALPQIECQLSALGIASAWQLTHDAETGIACLPKPAAQLDKLVDALGAACTGWVGVSPPYEDLRDTGSALRLARIALRSAFERQRVVVFDRDPLAVAAAGAPDVMRRLARTALAGLDRIPQGERELLLETFGAWLDGGGSADRAAKRMYVHPNTVRHRLRRLEEHTGRSLADPRWVAELSLAFEIDRRLDAVPARSDPGSETAHGYEPSEPSDTPDSAG
jgi:hypothetical protein